MAISPSKGTLWKRGNGASPEVYATIGEVGDFTTDGPTADVADVTPHSSSNWDEILAVLVRAGMWSGVMRYDPDDTLHALATGIYNDLVGLTDRASKIVLAGSAGEIIAASGYFTGHGFGLPVAGPTVANISYRPNGALTYSQS